MRNHNRKISFFLIYKLRKLSFFNLAQQIQFSTNRCRSIIIKMKTWFCWLMVCKSCSKFWQFWTWRNSSAFFYYYKTDNTVDPKSNNINIWWEENIVNKKKKHTFYKRSVYWGNQNTSKYRNIKTKMIKHTHTPILNILEVIWDEEMCFNVFFCLFFHSMNKYKKHKKS